MLLGARKVTDLWREDIISHVPDSLSPAVVGVAHSFHFGEDGADGRVCGLVTFLIDENPPVHDTESVLFKTSLQSEGMHKDNTGTAHSHQHNYQDKCACSHATHWLLFLSIHHRKDTAAPNYHSRVTAAAERSQSKSVDAEHDQGPDQCW